MKTLLSFQLIALMYLMCSCSKQPPLIEKDEAFSFAFMTDIHLNFGDNNCFQGFSQALAKADSLGVDLIITGGDNIDVDVVGDDIVTAERLYEKFKDLTESSATKINVSIGNHDRFWYEEDSPELHGAGMFSRYFGNTYFDYDHKGVHFIHLNTSEVCEGSYCVSELQIEWLNNLLSRIDKAKPLVVIAHVPFLSFYYPALEGRYTDTDIFSNFKLVWNMFTGYNLQLVLQDHMHLFEELNVLGTQFITGGAVSGNWWGGPYHGTREGFVLVEWDGDKMSWEYIAY